MSSTVREGRSEERRGEWSGGNQERGAHGGERRAGQHVLDEAVVERLALVLGVVLLDQLLLGLQAREYKPKGAVQCVCTVSDRVCLVLVVGEGVGGGGGGGSARSSARRRA